MDGFNDIILAGTGLEGGCIYHSVFASNCVSPGDVFGSRVEYGAAARETAAAEAKASDGSSSRGVKTTAAASVAVAPGDASVSAEHMDDTYVGRRTNLANGLIRALDLLANPDGSTYDEIVECLERSKWHDFSNCQTPHASVRSRAYVLIGKAREVLKDKRATPLMAYRKADETTNRLRLGSMTREQWLAIGIDPPPLRATTPSVENTEREGHKVGLSPQRTVPRVKRVKAREGWTPRRSSRIREHDSAADSCSDATELGKRERMDSPAEAAAAASANSPALTASRKRGRPRKSPLDSAVQNLTAMIVRIRENRRPLKRISYYEGDEDEDESGDEEHWRAGRFGANWLPEEETDPSASDNGTEVHGKRGIVADGQPQGKQPQHSRNQSATGVKPKSYDEVMRLAEDAVAKSVDGLLPERADDGPGPHGDEPMPTLSAASVDRHIELYLATRLLEARIRRLEEETKLVEAETRLVQYRIKLAKLRGESRNEE